MTAKDMGAVAKADTGCQLAIQMWGKFRMLLSVMDMEQLASMPSDQLELVLKLLKESRLLTEAETKKNEEIRKIKELELAAATIQQKHGPHLGHDRQSHLPSTSIGLSHGLDGFMANSIKIPSATMQVAEFEDLLRLSDLNGAGATQGLIQSQPRAPLPPHSVLVTSPGYAVPLSSLAYPVYALPTFFAPVAPLVSFASDSSSVFLQAPSPHNVVPKEYAPCDRIADLGGPASLVQMDLAAPLAAAMLPSSRTPMPAFSQVNTDGDTVEPVANALTPPQSTITTRSQIYPIPLKQRWIPPPPDTPPSGVFPDPSADDNLPSVNISRTSVRRRTRCRCCRVGICVFLLYGTTTPSLPPTPEEIASADDSVLCRACFAEREGDGAVGAVEKVAKEREDDEEAGVAAKMRKRRVRKVTQSTPLKCDACSREIGWGGMRTVAPTGARENEGEWTEPPFGVETVCDDCVIHF
ncbi:hypothetical protein HDU96_007161, partial [Phlyctochytrium bullatum]